MKFAFFGTPELATTALSEMKQQGCLPSLIVCNPDAPVGRKQIITPPPTKMWAEAHGIPVFQPTTLKNREDLSALTETSFDFFVVLAYGKIMPEWLIQLPKFGTINAHPSLLPKFRGASPIRSTLLHDLSACGVSIIQMDKDLDHGPLLLQSPYPLETPVPGTVLDTILARLSGNLLCDVMRRLPTGEITPIAQDHTTATFCTKITKDMAEITIDPYHLPTGDAAIALYRAICAFDGWPEAFFIHQGRRIKIKSAALSAQHELQIVRVVPEGKNEMDFAHYIQTLT
jgi:methionyl-tRNA formyltransferase